jgi:hypothetical protein
MLELESISIIFCLIFFFSRHHRSKVRLYQKLTLPLSGPPQRHPKQLESHDAAELSFQDKWRLPNLSRWSGTFTVHFHNLLQSAADSTPFNRFWDSTPHRSLAADPPAVNARSHWVDGVGQPSP